MPLVNHCVNVVTRLTVNRSRSSLRSSQDYIVDIGEAKYDILVSTTDDFVFEAPDENMTVRLNEERSDELGIRQLRP